MSETPPPPPPAGYTPPAAQAMSPEDQRLWATLTHIIAAVIFLVSVGSFGWLVALIAFLITKDRGGFVREHTRTALNFHITVVLAMIALYVIGFVTTIIGVGLVLLVLLPFAAPVYVIVFAIIAAVASNKGALYKYPLTINFVK